MDDSKLRAVPEGWKLVPIEPTREMMDDAFDNISLSDAHTTYGVTEHVWAYMLNAAPPAPIPAADHQETGREQDIDLEAIAWAYQKLLTYGVGNTNMAQALMMDRLNLMLLGAP